MIPRLKASIPPSVKVDLIADRSLTIRSSVRDVEFTLMITVGLVVMVIFIFLRSAWATVIPGIAVPLSLVATFGAMYLLGYSIDNLSLMALTISVGFVVDDAIVMLENIFRYIEMGERPFDAALKGAGQIGFTIVSITFSLVAVFIPLLLMGGIVGRLFREFAVTVTVAVIVSAFVSLSLSPVMASLFLKRETGHAKNPFNRAAERFFDWMIKSYDRGLVWVFRHQPLALGSTLVLIVVTGILYVWIPKGFFPEQDTGFIFGQAEARQDTSFAAMSKIEQQFAKILLGDPAVYAVVGFAGSTGGNPSESTARFFVQLKPFEERDVSAQQVIQRLRPKVAQVTGAFFFMQAGQDINVGGRLSKTEYQYTLTDTDSDELNHWAPIVQGEMEKLHQVQDVGSDQQISSPHIAIEVDRDAASRMGLNLSLIDETLYDAFGQRQVATIYTSTNQYKVILEVQPQFQNDPAALARIYVAGPGRLAGAARLLRAFHRQGRAAHGQPPGSIPLGDALLQSRTRLFARPGGRRHPGDPKPPAHAHNPRRLVPGHRTGLPGLVVLDPTPHRGGDPRGLHRAGHALRELHPSHHDPLRTSLGRRGSAHHAHALRLRSERHRPHRHHPLDRHREEECDHDDRLRARCGARGGQEPARGDSPGLSLALSSHHDDDDVGPFRQPAHSIGPRFRLGAAPAARHCHRRWTSGVPVPDALHHPDHLSLPRSRGPMAERAPSGGARGS